MYLSQCHKSPLSSAGSVTVHGKLRQLRSSSEAAVRGLLRMLPSSQLLKTSHMEVRTTGGTPYSPPINIFKYMAKRPAAQSGRDRRSSGQTEEAPDRQKRLINTEDAPPPPRKLPLRGGEFYYSNKGGLEFPTLPWHREAGISTLTVNRETKIP